MENPERWIMHRRANAAAGTSSGTSTPVPAPAPSSKGKAKAAPAPPPSNIRSRLLDKSVLSSARDARVKGPGRPMISVIKGSAGENGDDEMSGKKGKSSGREMEQDDDEFDYEEDFQDDEEGIAKIDDLADEEETKELEVRSLFGFEDQLAHGLTLSLRRNESRRRCEARIGRMRLSTTTRRPTSRSSPTRARRSRSSSGSPTRARCTKATETSPTTPTRACVLLPPPP